jgi:hypothetical protein
LYQQETGRLPASLEDLCGMEGSDRFGLFVGDDFLDGWRRPFIYATDGTTCTVTSLGRDGKPGGVGLNCDLTQADPDPPESRPTLHQFLFDCSTGGIVATCVFTGVIASILGWVLTKPAMLDWKGAFLLTVRLAATALGAVLVAMVLAVLHIPSGH